MDKRPAETDLIRSTTELKRIREVDIGKTFECKERILFTVTGQKSIFLTPQMSDEETRLTTCIQKVVFEFHEYAMRVCPILHINASLEYLVEEMEKFKYILYKKHSHRRRSRNDILVRRHQERLRNWILLGNSVKINLLCNTFHDLWVCTSPF
jgi:hypothetical protein